MQYLTIRNWNRWQTYRKDRGQPPYIKLHRRLLRDVEWVSLTDAERGQIICMWMLAADRDGTIPNDPILLQKLCMMTTPPDLKRFISIGFLVEWQGDAKVTPMRRHAVNHDSEA